MAFQSLEPLALSSASVYMEDLPRYYGVWSSLTCLELSDVDFRTGSLKTTLTGQAVDASCFKGLEITRIKELELCASIGLASAGEVLAIHQWCPDLEELSFQSGFYFRHENDSHLGHLLARYARYCPKLADFSIFVLGPTMRSMTS